MCLKLKSRKNVYVNIKRGIERRFSRRKRTRRQSRKILCGREQEGSGKRLGRDLEGSWEEEAWEGFGEANFGRLSERGEVGWEAVLLRGNFILGARRFLLERGLLFAFRDST